ncbi:Solute carrier family 12 member 2 [Liparis tanakae]|uniref:Solute carrier family 12 member 3 n=1 Tax=Liparis tanakae TaxID=230148 RepID=A0A4Z2FDL6_9TELE|nr:Solute carrier family 12 member 2 [Liparis tanakae]
MGQLASKRHGSAPGVPPLGVPPLGVPPLVHISTNDEGPPCASEPQGSRMEMRRSSVYSTLDLAPQLEHYAGTLTNRQPRSRPSLEVLRGSFDELEVDVEVPNTDSAVSSAPESGHGGSQAEEADPVRFGWMTGVMVRCMLNIWGVILFLRLSWITSQAGILLTWLIILMSVMVTSVTALSISAIATNGRVTSGGAYFMISRSLGPEIGGPIGVVFSFANALACALNTVGFAEVVRDLLQESGVVMVDPINDVRIVGVITVTALLLISLAGMVWESKAQILFFIVLLVSLANYLVGTFLPPDQEKQAQGIFGYRRDILVSNLKPDWRRPEDNFFQMFAIFFPSTIGILSGANISGDLKDPATAIPKGTLTAIFWTTICYLVIPVTVGSCVLRDASGNTSDTLTGNITDGCVGLGCHLGWNFTKCIQSQSSELNTIAALISNFFLCSYSLINFSCFYASITNSPGWRPSFHYYSKWTALFGAVVSVVLMILFTWWAALTTFGIIFFLFGYVHYNKPKVNWGSSVQAGTYNMALSYSVSLAGVEDHVKNFRRVPQCLVLTGPPHQRPALVDFVGSFTKHISLMICGDIIMEQDAPTRPPEAADLLVQWMNRRKVRSFYTPFTADSLRVGARHLLQASGLGKLKPNTLVLGFKSNWRHSSPESIEDYINTIYDTFDSNYCLCILRMTDGQDASDHFDFEVNQGFDPEEHDDQPSPERESADDISDKGDVDQMRTVFQDDQGKKTIDVYWIADDGGLTLLVPYLLTRRKRWHRSKIRVFIVGDEHNMEEGRREMVALLKRFRLDCSNVTVMTDSERPPGAKSLSRFVDSVAPFRLHEEPQEGSERKVRLNEILRRNSQHAALVLVSLPVPHRDCPSALYLAWLDTLTRGLRCPAVLIRGNQQNVLTFYCQ